MSARSRLLRLGSTTLVSALIAGAAMLAAPVAYAQTDVAAETMESAPDVQSVEPAVEVDDEISIPDTSAEPSIDVTPGPVPVEPAPAVEDVAQPEEDAAQPGPNAPEATEPAAPEVTGLNVTAGSLEWGVTEGLRAYADSSSGKAAKSLMGNTARTASAGSFVWGNGSGVVEADGASGQIEFISSDGVRFQAEPTASSHHVLDLQFSHPRITMTSASTGELRFDVTDRGATGSVEGRVSTDILLATLQFTAVGAETESITRNNVKVTVTPEGSNAVGGAFAAGELLDPITFSTEPTQEVLLVGDAAGVLNEEGAEDAALQTIVTVTASAASVLESAPVTITATVNPAEAVGEIQFFDGKEKLGNATPVSKSTARLTTTKLAVGTREISAEFTPADSAAFAASVSEKSARVVVKAKPVSGSVNNATLTWGVRAKFREYIYNFKAFEGEIFLLGSTAQPVSKGEFVWTGGSGTSMSDGSTADVSFGQKNGVHFRSHPLGKGYALDLQFTNPRVVVKSGTAGELRMDVRGRDYIDANTIGAEYVLKDVAMASLSLPAASAKGKTLTWSNAPAILTQEGAGAFGGFYEAGEALDPVTFSLPMTTAVTGKTATSTTLKASVEKIPSGGSVSLTATVSPKLAGTMTFSSAGKQFGKAVKVVNGQAKTSFKPADGTHSVIAAFTPDSDSYGHSVSSPIKITVEKKKVNKPDVAAPGNGAQSAGSLAWSISGGFADYATGPIAKGEVVTSGVGSSGGAYLFPQSGSTWDPKAQTGSVQYSGVVTFSGHKGLMSESFANPVITVTSATQGTLSAGGRSFGLNLGAASMSTGGNGEVSWSGVPVSGTISGSGNGGGGSFPVDSLSFTVGAASGVSYGATSVTNADKKRVAAEAAPTTVGIQILTDAKKITPGAELEFEAQGFESGEREMLVVLYPGITVLDEAAGADKQGGMRWLGTLPEDIQPGEYTITVQGSVDAGAVFTVVDEKKAKADKKKTTEAQADLAAGVNAEAVASAGVLSPGTGPVWLWWAGAGVLLAIAGSMGGLVVSQRRNASK